MGIEGKSKGAGHQKMIHPGSVRIRAYSGDCAEQRLLLVLRRNAVRVHGALFSAGKPSFRWNRVQTRQISFEVTAAFSLVWLYGRTLPQVGSGWQLAYFVSAWSGPQ